MGKKMITVSTTTCGHCRRLKSFMDSEYPDLEDRFTFINIDTDKDFSDDVKKTIGYMRQENIRGVPFTAIVENDTTLVAAIRGFNLDQFKGQVEKHLMNE